MSTSARGLSLALRASTHVRVLVQAATGASRALPRDVEDASRGSGAPDALRTAVGRGGGGAPGNVGVRLWGTKLSSPAVVAHIANLLGVPAPSQTTSVRLRGYPAQLGLAVDDYAQLRRYAKEAFGADVNIRVHRSTQLAHSTLDRPVFDLELEGVPED